MKKPLQAIQTPYKGYRFKSETLPAQPEKAMSQRADLTGSRFGRLQIVECLGLAGAGYRWWGCLCDCGVRVAVRSRELKRGHTQSCGCLNREMASARGGLNALAYGKASANELLGSYKKSARDRHFEWHLSDTQFFKLVTSDCSYCGVKPNKFRKPNKGVNGGFWYTGVDRLNSRQGYEVDNCTACCWDCNRAKGILSVESFREWISRLTKFQMAHGQSGATHA